MDARRSDWMGSIRLQSPRPRTDHLRSISSPRTISTTPTRHFTTTTAKMGKGVHNIQSKADFDSALATKDRLMVVDCFATWCGPCKVIAPKVVA